jgi:protoheme ferro-lyase
VSKKKLSIDVGSVEEAESFEVATEVVVSEVIDEVDSHISDVVDLHLNVYLKPTTKEVLLQAADRHKDKAVMLCKYANLSESALLGYVKQLG